MLASHIVPLSKKNHASITYTPMDVYSFSANRTTIPLLPFEVTQAEHFFPIIFPNIKNAIPYALLGLGDKNVYLDEEGHWNAPYIPLMVSNYPFSLIQAHFSETAGENAKKTELAIAIDEEAPHFHHKNGLPLYDCEGKETETLSRIKNDLITQYKRQKGLTHILEELMLHDVLRERLVTVHYKGMDKNVGGLRCADRDKIFSLPDETLGHWVKNGLMELLYSHWQSMRHLLLLLEDPSCPQSAKGAPVQ